jgi:hypothetical protein
MPRRFQTPARGRRARYHVARGPRVSGTTFVGLIANGWLNASAVPDTGTRSSRPISRRTRAEGVRNHLRWPDRKWVVECLGGSRHRHTVVAPEAEAPPGSRCLAPPVTPLPCSATQGASWARLARSVRRACGQGYCRAVDASPNGIDTSRQRGYMFTQPAGMTPGPTASGRRRGQSARQVCGAFEEDRLGRTRLSFPKICLQEDLERALS